MAQIDSGLGWNCDEAYFVKEISQKLSTHNVDFYKLNVGSAIACDIKDADGYICPFIVSTIPEYVTYTNNTTSLLIFSIFMALTALVKLQSIVMSDRQLLHLMM